MFQVAVFVLRTKTQSMTDPHSRAHSDVGRDLRLDTEVDSVGQTSTPGS